MNNTLTTERQREWVRQLYLHHDDTLKDIALQVGITESCLRAWVAEGGWAGQKRSLLASKQLQIEVYFGLLEQLTERMKMADEPNAKDADLLVKYTNAIKNLSEETDIPTIVQVAKQFTTWLRRRNQELAQQVTLQFDGFLKHKLSTEL